MCCFHPFLTLVTTLFTRTDTSSDTSAASAKHLSILGWNLHQIPDPLILQLQLQPNVAFRFARNDAFHILNACDSSHSHLRADRATGPRVRTTGTLNASMMEWTLTQNVPTIGPIVGLLGLYRPGRTLGASNTSPSPIPSPTGSAPTTIGPTCPGDQRVGITMEPAPGPAPARPSSWEGECVFISMAASINWTGDFNRSTATSFNRSSLATAPVAEHEHTPTLATLYATPLTPGAIAGVLTGVLPCAAASTCPGAGNCIRSIMASSDRHLLWISAVHEPTMAVQDATPAPAATVTVTAVVAATTLPCAAALTCGAEGYGIAECWPPCSFVPNLSSSYTLSSPLSINAAHLSNGMPRVLTRKLCAQLACPSALSLVGQNGTAACAKPPWPSRIPSSPLPGPAVTRRYAMPTPIATAGAAAALPHSSVAVLPCGTEGRGTVAYWPPCKSVPNVYSSYPTPQSRPFVDAARSCNSTSCAPACTTCLRPTQANAISSTGQAGMCRVRAAWHPSDPPSPPSTADAGAPRAISGTTARHSAPQPTRAKVLFSAGIRKTRSRDELRPAYAERNSEPSPSGRHRPPAVPRARDAAAPGGDAFLILLFAESRGCESQQEGEQEFADPFAAPPRSTLPAVLPHELCVDPVALL